MNEIRLREMSYHLDDGISREKVRMWYIRVKCVCVQGVCVCSNKRE